MAEDFFELTNLLGKRGLRQVKSFRRASEMQLFRHSHKVPQMPQFDF